MTRLTQFAAVLVPAVISGAEGADVAIRWPEPGGLRIEAECGDWLLVVSVDAEAQRADFRTVAPGECVVGEVTDWEQGSQSLATWLDEGRLPERGLRFVREAR